MFLREMTTEEIGEVWSEGRMATVLDSLPSATTLDIHKRACEHSPPGREPTLGQLEAVLRAAQEVCGEELFKQAMARVEEKSHA